MHLNTHFLYSQVNKKKNTKSVAQGCVCIASTEVSTQEIESSMYNTLGNLIFLSWASLSWFVVISKIFFFIFNVYRYRYFACMWSPSVCSAQGGQKGALHILSIELKTVMSHHVGTRNWTLVLWKSSQSSQPPRHFFGSIQVLLIKWQFILIISFIFFLKSYN